MSNPALIKTFTAGAAVDPARIVTLSAANTVTAANSATAASIGISDEIPQVATGRNVDVILSGVAWVTAGAAVALGAMLTSDATGRAVTSASAGNRIIGLALDAASAAGDRIRCYISQGVQ